MKVPAQLTLGTGTTGTLVANAFRRSQRITYGDSAMAALRDAIPVVGFDLVTADYPDLPEFRPIPPVAISTLKAAMASIPQLHHVATALKDINQDATIKDGNRGSMAVGHGSTQLRGEYITGIARASLDNARNPQKIQHALPYIEIDLALGTNIVHVGASDGSTGSQSDLVALFTKNQARLSGKNVDQHALVIGPGAQSAENTLQKISNTLATVLKIDAYQTNPREVYSARYGESKTPITLDMGEKLFKRCVFVSGDCNREKLIETAALIAEFLQSFSAPTEAAMQNRWDDFVQRGAHWMTFGVASIQYNPSILQLALQSAGESALCNRLLVGSSGNTKPTVDNIITRAKARIERLANATADLDLKVRLSEAEINAKQVRTSDLKSIVAKAEAEMRLTSEQQQKVTSVFAKELLNEFIQDLETQAANWWNDTGLNNTIVAFATLCQQLRAIEFVALQNQPRPRELLKKELDDAGESLDRTLSTTLKIGAATKAKRRLLAQFAALIADLTFNQQDWARELHQGLILAAIGISHRLKDHLAQIQAKRTQAEDALAKTKNMEIFGLGRMLPTEKQIVDRTRVWSTDRLDPLALRITASSSEGNIAQLIFTAVQDTLAFVTIPANLAEFSSALPPDEIDSLLAELKRNAAILPGIDHDAVIPGRIPEKHVTVLAPAATTLESKLNDLFQEGNHTPTLLHWNHLNEIRIYNTELGLYLQEFAEIRGAQTEIGELTPAFWSTRPCLFADQQKIWNYRPTTGRDFHAAEQLLSAALVTGQIERYSTEYRTRTMRLAQQLGIEGHTIARGIGDVIDFIASSSKARNALAQDNIRIQSELGIEEATRLFELALETADQFVPASFTFKFKGCVEHELETLQSARALATHTRRFSGNNGKAPAKPDVNAALADKF